MNFDSWKTSLVLAGLFLLSVSLFTFQGRPVGQSLGWAVGSVAGYYGVIMLKALAAALLVRLLSGGRVSFFLALSIAVLTLFLQQASADMLNLFR